MLSSDECCPAPDPPAFAIDRCRMTIGSAAGPRH
jgi:hypothetical protein